MIQWWAWIAIWAGLIIALLAMLGLCTWWLFRKFLVLVDDVADLADTTGILAVDDAALPQQAIAVLADVRDIRAREDARRAHRAARRRDRHDRRMSRARRITTVDATQQRWPSDWYGH